MSRDNERALAAREDTPQHIAGPLARVLADVRRKMDARNAQAASRHGRAA